MSEQEYYEDRVYLTNTFIGAFKKCQSAAIAFWQKEYKPPTTKAMLVGSYVDSHFSGMLDTFKEEHPEILNSRTGELKTDFKLAERLIQEIEGDPLFKSTLEGDTQRIFKGSIYGFKFKCKADSYNEKENRLTDLKTSRAPLEKVWSPAHSKKVSPIDRWGYRLQMAIYAELVKQNTGKLPQALLSIISKEDIPAKIIVEISPEEIEQEIRLLKDTLEELVEVISQKKEAKPCGHCEYCKARRKTKILTFREYQDLVYEN